MKKRKKTVSLVLGSGGARGLAHIGVIDWLTEHDFEVCSIAGTSMGALVGGIFAAGKLDVYRDWVLSLRKSDIVKILDISFTRGGLFKGEKLIEKLKELCGDNKIDDLPIRFTAVATDIDSGKEVWFNKGPLFDAIRASIAVPLIFTPFVVQGRHLLDGGMVNPVPIAPTLSDMTDITIAVNVDSEPDMNQGQVTSLENLSKKSTNDDDSYAARIKSLLSGLFEDSDDGEKEALGYVDIMVRSLDIMQNNIARLKLAAYSPDVTISISRDSAQIYEFYRARELIKLGYDKAAKELSWLIEAD